MVKKNLLILGASGGVATTLLLHLTYYRTLLDKIILLDKSDSFLNNPFIDHTKLNYHFIKDDFRLPASTKKYTEILKKYQIDIVIDLTDLDTFPLLKLTNELNISYLNTCMNDPEKTSAELIYELKDNQTAYTNVPHIVCAGMNPGAVNMWAAYGITKFGIPKEIIHFEYDTSIIKTGWQPKQTWSRYEFIVEGILNPAGIMLGRRKSKDILPNGIKNRIDMTDIVSPIMPMESYPKGFQILHEENVSIAEKYDIPSQFIYAINERTMDYLEKLYDSGKEIAVDDLVLGDNTTIPLLGADNIGVCLEYSDKRIYYFNAITNKSAKGTNATYTQVVLGILPALFVLVFESLKPQVYFVEDLFNTIYPTILFDLMDVQVFVFTKHAAGLQLTSHQKAIRMNKPSPLKSTNQFG